MAKSGNTWQKKLMAKQKKNWMRERLGTCTRLSPRGLNNGQQFGIVEKSPEPGKVVSTGPHARFVKPSFNKWRRYALAG